MQRSFVALLLVCLAACSGKKELDVAAEKLIDSYAAGDYQAFKSLVHPEIAAQIPEEKFAYTAKALASLGAPTDRSMSSISVKAGGPSEGHYTLTYPTGEVEFDLKVFEGTLVGFNLQGDILNQAMREVVTREFKVSAFTILDKPGGTPRVGTAFTRDELIAFRMQVMGLTEMEREVHMRLILEVLAPDGTVGFKKVLIDQRSKLEPGALPMANPTGSLNAGAPGSYRLRLTVEDVFGKRSQSVEQDLTVQAS